jgi:acyl-CoA thioesterase FadM
MSTLTNPTALLTTLRTHLPTLPTWRTTLILVLLLTNLKSLPLAWHVRLLHRFFGGLYSAADVKKALSSSIEKSQKDDQQQQQQQSPRRTHPIFTEITIKTHAPLLEIDYNLHKSNSTYFSDLDESRTALMAKILGPAFFAKKGNARGKSDAGFEEQGIKGRVAVILGSVHCSFHKEIAAYEGYEVRSRVLGWDRKWLVLGSWLVKRKKGKEGKVEEVLLASALSKYVVKKGRFTVSPEHCLRVAGWLPERPVVEGREGLEESAVLVGKSEGETTGTEGTPVLDEGLGQGSVEEVKEKLEQVTAERREEELEERIVKAAEGPEAGDGPWDWDRIEKERLRGLSIAEGWLALDVALKEEFAREV